MPRCKHCKEQFKPIKFNQKYCLKPECVEVWVRLAKEKQWQQRKKKLKKQLKTAKDYKKEAQFWVNKYVRIRDRNDSCISCNKPLHDIKFDAGHFFSAGGHSLTTFDLDNIHGQCVECNRWKHGNIFEYQKKLIDKIGYERFQKLEKRSNGIKKWTKEELIQIIDIYKKRCKQF